MAGGKYQFVSLCEFVNIELISNDLNLILTYLVFSTDFRFDQLLSRICVGSYGPNISREYVIFRVRVLASGG